MTVEILHAVSVIAAGVVAIAGASKLMSPESARDALRAQRIPATSTMVRTLGAAEIVIGAAVFVTANRAALAALATLYVAFAIFVARAARRGTPCGCLGGTRPTSAPAHMAHAVVNGFVAIVAATLMVVEVPGYESVAGRPLAVAGYVVLSVVGTVLGHEWLATETATR